ncbi:hypothetical protein M569_11428, partial [Genlisea aurea]
MSRLGFNTVVYDGEVCLGEIETIPVKDVSFQFPGNEIRIHHISPPSERCHPLAVLHTVSGSFRCKLEPCSNGNSKSDSEHSQLINLHCSCFYELKTAVVLLGSEEIHLVAMPSKNKKFPCFWCYSVPRGLYGASLGMLNLRCLSIVFDLDETLIVANTMKSFEDRIEALMGWIDRENDPVRESVMTAEMKRYVEDRALLKQYAETDCVVDCGKVYNMQLEEFVLHANENHRVVRPVVRLPEKNIVLTRINPENRDTSVLVRLRPSWDEFKSYLTAKDRKRFEVYVCTMAERDYALEMWRLLDPEAHLINKEQLPDRVVCVKYGARKSLINVFHDGNCHPRMAMVIDDRLKVWDEKDQPRVHVVPAFTPYYAPQAETASSLAVLCVARNVACNVRTCFFKEFDDNILWRISGVFYEDEIINLPTPPDVSNYLVSEDASFIPNGNPNLPSVDVMNGAAVTPRLWDEKMVDNDISQTTGSNDKTEAKRNNISKVPPGAAANAAVSASTRGTLLRIRKPGSWFPTKCGPPPSSPGDPPFLSRFPSYTQRGKSSGGWLVEEDADRVLSASRDSGAAAPQDSAKNAAASRSGNAEQQQQQRLSQPRNGEVKETSTPADVTEINADVDRINPLQSLYMNALLEIGRRCNSKVEFRAVVRTASDSQFSAEVFFTGEKIGVGIGNTKKDAQQQAAENALRSLASEF